jgi:hypothetical protein
MSDGISTLIRSPSVVDDRIAVINRDIRALSQWGQVIVTVAQYVQGRSLSQNDMHCGLCRDIATEMRIRTGLDYDAEYFRTKTKRLFGVKASQIDPATGKDEPYLVSTTKYSKAEFSKLIDGTLAWALTDLKIPLVDPRAAA